ncbi:unnamed protein product [Discosporangium mesarthrocarpum]
MSMVASTERAEAVSLFKKYLGPKKLKEIPTAEASAGKVFDTIEKIYGSDNALKMVKAVPGVLGYGTENMKPSFDAFSETFGVEETKGMVTRNPNLLAVRPSGFGGACNAKDDTMYASYVIAYTRPIGGLLLGGLFLLLCIPVAEISTGIPRQELLQTIFSTFSGSG